MKAGTKMTKPTEISVTVSKKMSSDFNSIGLTVSLTTTVDETDDLDIAYSGNWGICWDEIDKQEEAIKEKLKTIAPSTPVVQVAPVVTPVTAPVTPQQEIDPIMSATTPVCPIHGATVVYRPSGISKKTGKGYAGFYACTARNADNSFCTSKFQ